MVYDKISSADKIRCRTEEFFLKHKATHNLYIGLLAIHVIMFFGAMCYIVYRVM